MSHSNQTFRAWYFHPEIGNEVIDGHVIVERSGVRFQSNRVNDELPCERISIWFEGDDNDRIVFGDTERPGLKVFSDDGDILNCRALPALALARERLIKTATKRDMSRRVRILSYFLAGSFLVFWMGTCTMSMMVRSLAAKVPPEWEQGFSELQLAMVCEESVLRTNTSQVAHLNALAQPLIDALPPGKRKFRFFILEDSTPNAFALPNGYVVVHTGLIDMVDRPEELLGVVAHEIAHVTENHTSRKIIAGSGPLIIVGVFLGSGGVGGLLTAGTGLMVYQGFSQAYETEADNTGWDYLVKARINPQGMITMFQKLRVYEATHEFIDVPQAFQSHPALQKRIARLEKRWQKVSAGGNFTTLTNRLEDLRTP